MIIRLTVSFLYLVLNVYFVSYYDQAVASNPYINKPIEEEKSFRDQMLSPKAIEDFSAKGDALQPFKVSYFGEWKEKDQLLNYNALTAAQALSVHFTNVQLTGFLKVASNSDFIVSDTNTGAPGSLSFYNSTAYIGIQREFAAGNTILSNGSRLEVSNAIKFTAQNLSISNSTLVVGRGVQGSRFETNHIMMQNSTINSNTNSFSANDLVLAASTITHTGTEFATDNITLSNKSSINIEQGLKFTAKDLTIKSGSSITLGDDILLLLGGNRGEFTIQKLNMSDSNMLIRTNKFTAKDLVLDKSTITNISAEFATDNITLSNSSAINIENGLKFTAKDLTMQSNSSITFGNNISGSEFTIQKLNMSDSNMLIRTNKFTAKDLVLDKSTITNISAEFATDNITLSNSSAINIENGLKFTANDLTMQSNSSITFGNNISGSEFTIQKLNMSDSKMFIYTNKVTIKDISLNNSTLTSSLSGNFLTRGNVVLSNKAELTAENGHTFMAQNLTIQSNSKMIFGGNIDGSIFKVEDLSVSDSTLDAFVSSFVTNNINTNNSTIRAINSKGVSSLGDFTFANSRFETGNSQLNVTNLNFTGDVNSFRVLGVLNAKNITAQAENNSRAGVTIGAQTMRYHTINLTNTNMLLEDTVQHLQANTAEKNSQLTLLNSNVIAPVRVASLSNISAHNSTFILKNITNMKAEKILLNNSTLESGNISNFINTVFVATDISINSSSSLIAHHSDFKANNIDINSAELKAIYSSKIELNNLSLTNNSNMKMGIISATDSSLNARDVTLDSRSTADFYSSSIIFDNINAKLSKLNISNVTFFNINNDIILDGAEITINKLSTSDNALMKAKNLIMKNNSFFTNDLNNLELSSVKATSSTFRANDSSGVINFGKMDLQQSQFTLFRENSNSTLQATDMNLSNSTLTSNASGFTANNINLSSSTLTSKGVNSLELNNVILDSSHLTMSNATSFFAKNIILTNNSVLSTTLASVTPFDNLTLKSSTLQFSGNSKIITNMLNVESGVSNITHEKSELLVSGSANIHGVLNVNKVTFSPTDAENSKITIFLSQQKAFDPNNFGGGITSGIKSNNSIAITNKATLAIDASSLIPSNNVLKINEVFQIELMYAKTGGIDYNVINTIFPNHWIGATTKVICQVKTCNNNFASSLIVEFYRKMSYENVLNQEYISNNKTPYEEILQLSKILDYGMTQENITANLGDLYNDIDYKVLVKSLEEKINSLRPISNDVYIFDIHEKTNTLRSIAKKHVSGKTSNKDVWLSIDYAIGSFTDGFLSRNTAAKKSNSNTAYLSSGFEVGDFNGAISVYKSNFKNKNVYDVDGTGIGVMADYTKKFFSIYGSYNTSMYKAQRHDIMGNTALSKPKVQEFSLGVDLIYAKEGFLPFGAADTKSTAKTKKGFLRRITPKTSSTSMFSNTHHMGVSLGFITTAGMSEKSNNDTNAGLLNEVAATTAFVPEAYYSYTLKATVALKSGVIEPFISLSGGYSAYVIKKMMETKVSEINSEHNLINYSNNNNSTPFGKAGLGVDYVGRNISTGIASNIKITTISTNILSSVYLKYKF